MSLDLDAVGRMSDSVEHRWDSADALLYALGVGAGQEDPTLELAFTTENTEGVEQQVIPTFALILTQFRGGTSISFGDYDSAQLLHAEQHLVMRRPLPSAGSLRVQSKLTGIWDKGSGALTVTETSGWLPDDADDEPSVIATSAAFIKGEGGFGRRQPTVQWQEPLGEPSFTLAFGVRSDQALLYRLSGDRNPLHTDPAFAARGGFKRPILHGLCTYGSAARVLLRALGGGDPARFVSMSGRFSQPVFPGEDLKIDVWANDSQSDFRILNQAGAVVLSRGRFIVGPAA
jgi:acyl dehydratase